MPTDSSFTHLKLSKKGMLEGGKHLGEATQQQTSNCHHSAWEGEKNQGDPGGANSMGFLFLKLQQASLCPEQLLKWKGEKRKRG